MTVVDQSLAAGGGIWGGGMAMNEIVVDKEAAPVLRKVGVPWVAAGKDLYTLDACALASALCYAAVRAGAVLFNLTTVEDLCVNRGRVTGVVIDRTLVAESLPIDPVTLTAKAVVDATGHHAALVKYLAKRNLLEGRGLEKKFGEWPMNPAAGEAFVIEKTGEISPGLWVTGMSVASVFGGPRMGPIFKGMLISGKYVADQIIQKLKCRDAVKQPRVSKGSKKLRV